MQRLCEEADGHFAELEHLAKRDEDGIIFGILGAMSDFSHSFKTWEESYPKGAYPAFTKVIAYMQEQEIELTAWRWCVISYKTKFFRDGKILSYQS